MVSAREIQQITVSFNNLLKEEEETYNKLLSELETLKDYEYNLDLLKSEEYLKYLESIKDEKTNEEFRKNSFNLLLADMPGYITLKNNIKLQERSIKKLEFNKLKYRDLIRYHLALLEVYKNVE